MQDITPSDKTEDGATPPPETSLITKKHLPANPVQPMPRTWPINSETDPEFESPWHSAQDVGELEETLDQAVEHIKALLRLTHNRTNVSVQKAWAFLEQFT